jgi:hypothetical protein
VGLSSVVVGHSLNGGQTGYYGRPLGRQMTVDINQANDSGPVGLRGWLLLVGIGVILGPIRLMMGMVSIYAPFWDAAMISIVTDPFAENFNPLISALVIGGFAANTSLLLAQLYLIYGYFKQKKWFPRVYVSVLLLSIIYIFLDALAAAYAFPGETVWDNEAKKDLTRLIISAFIWVPYMFVSRRVKNTFVR